MILIEHRLVSQHGAGHPQQTVSHGPQGPRMAVAALPEGLVFGSAGGVVLCGYPGPMIGRLAQTRVNRLAAHHAGVLPERRVTGATPHRQRKAA